MPEAASATQRSTPTQPAGSFTVVCSGDEVRDVLQMGRDYLGGRVQDPSDPRGTGIQGQGTLHTDATPGLRKALAKKVGLYKAIVTKPPTDVWSAGWDPQTDNDELRAELKAFDASVRVWPTLRGIKAAFKRAHHLARRDGRALVHHRLRDATGDAEQEPTGVQSYLAARVIPNDQIEEILVEDDLTSDRWGQPRAYRVRDAAGQSKLIHWQRAQLVIEEPDEDAETTAYHGESALDAHLLNAQGYGNIGWAATEAYYRGAAPLYVVTVEPDADYEDGDLDDLEDKIGDLQSNVSQKLVLEGAEIQALQGSDKVNDPTPFADLHREDAAAGSSIPKRELTGSEAGALEAAKWDERRYHASVVSPLQEEFATGIVLEWYERLQAWGLVPTGSITGITWHRAAQFDELEQAEMVGEALKASVRAGLLGLPMPKELRALLTFPPDVDLDEPLQLASKGASGGNLPAGAGDTAEPGVRWDLVIRASKRLRELEEEFERVLRDALRSWRHEVEDVVQEHTGSRFSLKSDASEAEEVQRAILALRFKGDELAEVITELLQEAGDLGFQRAWRDMPHDQVVDFVETTQYHAFREYAEEYARDRAETATRAVRSTVADVINEGGAVREIREALRDEFGRLENETAIARTESMRGYNQGALQAIQDAGVKRYRYVAYPGACEVCAPLDGQTFTVGEGPTPPDSTHPHCRCTIIAEIPNTTVGGEAS